MRDITQRDCNAIPKKLNARPRKRYGFKSPEEMIYADWSVLQFKLETKRRDWTATWKVTQKTRLKAFRLEDRKR